MNEETEGPRRAWNDNHPWIPYVCVATDDDGNLLLHGQKIQIRWVFQAENFTGDREDGTDELVFRGLAYDRKGIFYGITEYFPVGCQHRRSVVTELAGKQALTWFAEIAVWDAWFAGELIRAIDNPQFEFRPFGPGRFGA